MEVHAHTHTPRKKWTHYLWEFLMLFLAVFCGFLAENQREHMVEHNREQNFIHSLIQDLKTDTANLQLYMDVRNRKHQLLDSLILLLSTDLHKTDGDDTYYFARQIFNGNRFVNTDGTIQQLKNGGNLRMIKNEKSAAAILAYYAAVKMLEEWDETDSRVRITFREMGGQIYNSNIFYHLMDSNMNFLRPSNNPQLITEDLSVINNVTFQIQYLSTITRGNFLRAQYVKETAVQLIDILKKEYHL